MNMNRRSFVKGSSTGLLYFVVGGSAIALDGCSVFTDILNWIPTGLTAIQGIVTILGPLIPPQALAVIVVIKAGFADLQAAVAQYNADTNPADKATLLAKIRTFLGDITNNFQSFLNALNLGNNPIINIVIGLADIVISAIEGFMGQLPSPAPVPATLRLGAKVVTITPKFYKNTSDFKKDYNSFAIANGHPEIKIN